MNDIFENLAGDDRNLARIITRKKTTSHNITVSWWERDFPVALNTVGAPQQGSFTNAIESAIRSTVSLNNSLIQNKSSENLARIIPIEMQSNLIGICNSLNSNRI